MIKVRRLKVGSKIAIISPSNGLPHRFPEIYELGLKNLEELFGFEIVEYPSARLSTKELYNNPKLRAEDINKAFMDDSIDGIICSIGGYESVRILDYLDTEAILNYPKMIMGFSDATTFLTYLNNLGLITFYGPTVMAGLAQLKNIEEGYTKHICDILLDREIPYAYKPYSKWTHGYKDWTNMDTLGECTEFHPGNTEFQFLQEGPVAEGYLWGGGIEVLEFLKGTKYWPSKTFFQDKVLIFETSEEKPSPMHVGYMIRNYGTMGVLNDVKGIIVARPKDYTHEENEELQDIIKSILEVEFNIKDIPVIVNMDFGHTDPKVIFPLGCKVKLDSKQKQVVLLESAFE